MFAKLGFRFELATRSLVIWLWKKRYTIYRAKKGVPDFDPLAVIRKMKFLKVGNLA